MMDDRKEFATRKLHPDADQVIHTDKHYSKGKPGLDEETYAVIVTRCHATDKLLVKQLQNESVAYLGLIGSKAKIRQFHRELEEEGISRSYLQSIHAPIGLPIGGKDPAEVAISILAEVIQVKNERSSSKISYLQVKDQHSQ